jgi:hypothetical protein
MATLLVLFVVAMMVGFVLNRSRF